jgi:type 1 glutamine amidotransferase
MLAAAMLAPLAPQAQAQGRRMTQGGSGPIQVLLVTKGHAFDRENFFNLFDALGETITWTHVEQPAAQIFWDPKMAEPYDVFVYYDAMGRSEIKLPDGSMGFEKPPQKSQDGLEALLKSGKGMVFFHHAIAAWNQTWDEYSEIMGGACDWRNPVTKRGVKYPFSGFQPNTKQHTSVVPEAKGHPILEGLGDGFDIVDEAYACPYFEDSIHPLLRTNFVAKPENFTPARTRDPNWNHPLGSNLEAWYKAAENSPIVYIQHGHDNQAWANPAFQKLMANAIKWAASDEALKWAKEHPQKIFK